MTSFKKCPQSLSRLALYCLILHFLVMHPCSALCAEAPIISGNTKMTCGQQQVLSIMNYLTGNTYTWTITSGGGTLSSNTGENVIYTAPAENPSCQNNPTITASCDGGAVIGSITIAVNCYSDEDAACGTVYGDVGCFENCPWPAEPCGCGCKGRYHLYSCDGAYIGTSQNQLAIPYPTAQSCGDADCWNFGWRCEGLEGTEGDFRSPAMMAAGCCPEVFLAGYEPEPKVPEDTNEAKDPEANEPVCDPASVADPISIYNGNTSESKEDFRFASLNRRGLFLKRFYNSKSEITGPLGYGWTHTYNIVLNLSHEFEGTVYLKIGDETGRGVYFEADLPFRNWTFL
jgi:hypothetical protein